MTNINNDIDVQFKLQNDKLKQDFEKIGEKIKNSDNMISKDEIYKMCMEAVKTYSSSPLI